MRNLLASLSIDQEVTGEEIEKYLWNTLHSMMEISFGLRFQIIYAEA